MVTCLYTQLLKNPTLINRRLKVTLEEEMKKLTPLSQVSETGSLLEPLLAGGYEKLARGCGSLEQQGGLIEQTSLE